MSKRNEQSAPEENRDWIAELKAAVETRLLELEDFEWMLAGEGLWDFDEWDEE